MHLSVCLLTYRLNPEKQTSILFLASIFGIHVYYVLWKIIAVSIREPKDLVFFFLLFQFNPRIKLFSKPERVVLSYKVKFAGSLVKGDQTESLSIPKLHSL